MSQSELIVKMALAGWKIQIDRATATLESLSDQDLQKQVAPGRNRIIYLYGHLSTYHDALKETLGIGKRHRPELHAPFLQNPDDIFADIPSALQLRAFWSSIHSELDVLFGNLSAEQWFERHHAMTDEDFERDPSRNRLSVLLNRTNHVAYHMGQIKLA
jgi:hypothetical protein